MIYSTAFQQWRISLGSCDTDHDGKQNVKVKKECNCISLPLFWDSQRQNKESWQSTLHVFFIQGKKSPQPGISTEKSKLCIIPQSKISMQGHYSGDYKMFQSGFQTYHSKCTKFNFFISLNLVELFYIIFNWFIFIKILFLH